MSNLIGQTIGQYQIIEHLGKGGMAEVYKAYQAALDRYVAIKVLHPIVATDEQFLTRFQSEARSVATLRHQHIVQIFDFGNEGKTYYMVMEFVDGQTLKQKLGALSAEGKVMTPENAAKIVRQVAQALDYAHERGLIHRDVKPANILLTSEGDAVLSDFGIARMVESTRQTMTGVVGTPEYMSPEQGQGKDLDARSDVYSLGVVLYEMLTGKMPYHADTPLAVIFKHVRDPLPLPRAVNPDLPEPVERVILKSLAKAAAGRYDSAGEMAVALNKAVRGEPLIEIHDRPTERVSSIQEPSSPKPEQEPTPAAAVKPRPRRAWGRIVAIVAALILVGGLAAVGVIFGPQLVSELGAKTPTPINRTATVAEVEGDVQARTRASSEWTSAFVGMTLYSDSAIRVPDDGYARIRFDEALVRLAPDSELNVKKIQQQAENRIARLNLARGRLWVQLNSEAVDGAEFSIALPAGQVALSAGRCSVSVTQAGNALVSIQVGRATVSTDTRSQTLNNDQEIAVNASGDLSTVESMSETEQALWENHAVGPELSLATPTHTPTPTTIPTEPPTPTLTPTDTPVPTLTPTDTPTITPTPTPTDIPTDTPIPTATSTPTLAPTNTPPPTATRRPTNTPLPTATPTVTPTYEPLGAFYWDYQTSELSAQGDYEHWQLYVYFHVTGGDGNYTFYDGEELLGPGPEFTFIYGCGAPKLGKFTVVSGDGQRWEKDYYFDPHPCVPKP